MWSIFSETSIHSMFHFNAKNIVHSCWRLPILDNNKYICMTHVCNRNIKHTMAKCKLASMNLFGNKSLNQFGPSLLIHSIYKYYKCSVMIRNTKSCWPLWNETFQCSLSLNVCVCVRVSLAQLSIDFRYFDVFVFFFVFFCFQSTYNFIYYNRKIIEIINKCQTK